MPSVAAPTSTAASSWSVTSTSRTASSGSAARSYSATVAGSIRPAPGSSNGARLRTTTYALYPFLDEDEGLRRFTVVEARTAGKRAALLIGQEIDALFDLIDKGRTEPTAPFTLTRATAESVGGGIFSQMYTAAGRDGPMPDERKIMPEIMYLAVLPYLGPASAAEELVILPPPARE
jgi:hypothetical protein